MAQPRRYTYTAATAVQGGQDVINLDWNIVPFQASILVDLVSGLITYSVEFTTDNLDTGNPTTWRWLPLAGFPYGTTANASNPSAAPNPLQWTLNFPVTAIRLNIQSLTGTVNFSVIQGHDI